MSYDLDSARFYWRSFPKVLTSFMNLLGVTCLICAWMLWQSMDDSLWLEWFPRLFSLKMRLIKMVLYWSYSSCFFICYLLVFCSVSQLLIILCLHYCCFIHDCSMPFVFKNWYIIKEIKIQRFPESWCTNSFGFKVFVLSNFYFLDLIISSKALRQDCRS